MPFMAAAAPYLLAAGAGLSAVSSIASGVQQSAAMREQARAAEYNRQVALQGAEATRKAGEFAEEQKRKEGLRILGAQKAAYGKAGVVMEGTPLEVVAQTAAELEQEALASRYNYAVESARYTSEAGFYGYEAERQRNLAGSATTMGILKAGTSLLTTAGAWGMASKYPGSGTGSRSVYAGPGLIWNPA